MPHPFRDVEIAEELTSLRRQVKNDPRFRYCFVLTNPAPAHWIEMFKVRDAQTAKSFADVKVNVPRGAYAIELSCLEAELETYLIHVRELVRLTNLEYREYFGLGIRR